MLILYNFILYHSKDIYNNKHRTNSFEVGELKKILNTSEIMNRRVVIDWKYKITPFNSLDNCLIRILGSRLQAKTNREHFPLLRLLLEHSWTYLDEKRHSSKDYKHVIPFFKIHIDKKVQVNTLDNHRELYSNSLFDLEYINGECEGFFECGQAKCPMKEVFRLQRRSIKKFLERPQIFNEFRECFEKKQNNEGVNCGLAMDLRILDSMPTEQESSPDESYKE